MKAAVLQGKGKFDVREVPVLKPGKGQVLIKVICCGICGSDVHLLHYDRTPTGITPGHEWVGTIVELGEGVENWKTGDRVVLHGYPGNLSMPPEMIGEFLKDPAIALSVHPAIRAGGFAEYLLWDQNHLNLIPNNVSDEEAALVDTLAVAFGAIKRADMKGGEKVLIIGGGPIGLSVIPGVQIDGASLILLNEPVEYRRNIAKEMGANQVLDPTQGDVRLPVLMQTGGGADIVFDCVGSPLTIQQSVDMARPGGKVVLVGMTFNPAQILPLAWLAREITFMANMHGDSPRVVKLLGERRLDVAKLVTGKVSLDDIQKGFEMAVDANNQIKILVYP